MSKMNYYCYEYDQIFVYGFFQQHLHNKYKKTCLSINGFLITFDPNNFITQN